MTKYAAFISLLVLALISSSVKANTSQANVLLILTDNQAYNELSFKGHLGCGIKPDGSYRFELSHYSLEAKKAI